MFRERIDEHNSQNLILSHTNVSYSIWSTYFYDSLWAWSVVLDSLSRKHPSLDLTKDGYGDTSFSDMVMEEFYILDFEGVSGSVKFLNDSGSIVRMFSVSQVINGTAQQVAYCDATECVFNCTKKFLSISDKFEDEILRVSKAVVVLFLTITLLQLAVLICLHVLTIKYRSYPLVKASSFKLNIILYVGCYALVIFLLVETVGRLSFDVFPTSFVCNLTTVWMLPVIFTLIFGTVAVRTWRLYRIFTHYLHPSRFIGDYYLMAFVVFLVLVDIVIGTVWMAVDPYNMEFLSFPYRRGIAIFQVKKSVCVNEIHPLFLAISCCWKVVLMIVIIVLVFVTRNITNQTFTTKTLRVFVFLFCLIVLVGFSADMILFEVNPVSDAHFFVYITTYSLALLLSLVFILLPPLIPLIREKFLSSKKRSFQ